MKTISNEENLSNYLHNPHYRELFPRTMDEYARLHIFRQQEEIIHQGEEPAFLYYLFSGSCKISAYMENGKAIILKKNKAPCLLGEIELFLQDYSFSVEALSECIVFSFPIAVCKQILLNDKTFLLSSCRLLAQKERSSSFELSKTLSFPLINRLAAFIIDNATGGILNIKKTIIAESLGVSYRHLEKVMNDLVEEKILIKNGRSYRISKADELARLAQSLEIF